MSYVNSNLLDNEKVLYRGTVTLWAISLWILGCLFFGSQSIMLLVMKISDKSKDSVPLGFMIFYFLMIFVCALFGYLKLNSIEAAITNKRLITKTGIIRRDTIEIPIRKISSLQVKQGFFGRIFGFGSLVISDAGAAHAPVSYIIDPMKFRKRFFEIQEKIEEQAARQQSR